MIKEYVKIATVKALQVTPDNHEEVKEFAYPQSVGFGLFHVIDTLEGEMFAPFGHYLIRGVEGEIYACEPNIFNKTYELLGESE